MNSHTYAVMGENMTVVNAAVTLAFIRPPATGLKEIELVYVEIGFAGDTTSRQHRYQIVTQVTAFPTLVAATPVPLDLSSPVSLITGGTGGAAGTSGVNASAEGGGTKTIRHAGVFNNLQGLVWAPPFDDRIIVPVNSTSGIGIFLPASPGTGAALNGWAITAHFAQR